MTALSEITVCLAEHTNAACLSSILLISSWGTDWWCDSNLFRRAAFCQNLHISVVSSIDLGVFFHHRGTEEVNLHVNLGFSTLSLSLIYNQSNNKNITQFTRYPIEAPGQKPPDLKPPVKKPSRADAPVTAPYNKPPKKMPPKQICQPRNSAWFKWNRGRGCWDFEHWATQQGGNSHWRETRRFSQQ